MSVSIELFPPRTADGEARLNALLTRLSAFEVAKLSVTEGALASDAEGSMETIAKAQVTTGLPITSHLAAWGKSRQDIDWQLDQLRHLDVRSVLALRGDKRDLAAGEFQQADQLTDYIAKSAPDMEIGVAAYPESHPEDQKFDQTLDILASKADSGARFAVTQFSFDMAALLRLREAMERRRIDLDLHIGVLPIRDLNSARRLALQCGANIPKWIETWIASWEGETGQSWNDLGAAALALDWCQQLQRGGFGHLHLYALNQAEPTLSLLNGLGLGIKAPPRAATIPSRADFPIYALAS